MQSGETKRQPDKETAMDKIPTAPITESLAGILKGDWDLEQVKEESMREKYGMGDG